MSTEANMSTESVVMQTIELPKGSMILGTSNRYHGDGSISVDVQYSVQTDSPEQTPKPPVSAIVIRDGKPRNNREEAPLRWLATDKEIVRAVIDDDFENPQQFYRVLPIDFTLDDWYRLVEASSNSSFDMGGTSCLLHSKLLSIISYLEAAEKQ